LQGILTENPRLPNNLLKKDEAHFHVRDTANKQNFGYSLTENPHELHPRPRYDSKVTV
jgi:hypothetical protein